MNFFLKLFIPFFCAALIKTRAAAAAEGGGSRRKRRSRRQAKIEGTQGTVEKKNELQFN